MKKIDELFFGFSDAVNYINKEQKEIFKEIFVKEAFMDDILKRTTYFILGEKGTGKTAYAAFLANGLYKEKKSMLSLISETDYQKFYNLKTQKHLELTDFMTIWKVIILFLLAKEVAENNNADDLVKNKVGQITSVLDRYYDKAFSPNISVVMKILDENEVAANIISAFAKVEGKTGNKIEYTETKFQDNMYYLEKKFSELFTTLKLKRDITLFIDGIDIRPDSIPYSDYIECIKGLGNAVWALNTGLFQKTKDSKGYFKVVILLRPDIFHSLNLQNLTNKAIDNSVFLDWTTGYENYKSSYLYKVGKSFLCYGQKELSGEDLFEKYFPWCDKKTNLNAFKHFLKISLTRPRDIIEIISIMGSIMKKTGKGNQTKFDEEIFWGNEFQNKYSQYFISSIRDQLLFYYTREEFDYLVDFLDFFERKKFTYEEFKEKYNNFIDYFFKNEEEKKNKSNIKDIPKYFESPKNLLQLMYDANIIFAYKERIDYAKKKKNYTKEYIYFSYKEKNFTNIAPRVPMGDNIKYMLHFGIFKAKKMGGVYY